MHDAHAICNEKKLITFLRSANLEIFSSVTCTLETPRYWGWGWLAGLGNLSFFQTSNRLASEMDVVRRRQRGTFENLECVGAECGVM